MPLVVWSGGLKAFNELWGSVDFTRLRPYSLGASFMERHAEAWFVVDAYSTESEYTAAFVLFFALTFYSLVVQGISTAELLNIYRGGAGRQKLVEIGRTGTTIIWWSGWYGINTGLDISNKYLDITTQSSPRDVNYIISYKLLFPFLL